MERHLDWDTIANITINYFCPNAWVWQPIVTHHKISSAVYHHLNESADYGDFWKS